MKKLPDIDVEKIDKEALNPEILQKTAAYRKEENDRRTLQGKYAPPTGVCKVCSDRVIARVAFKNDGLIGGTPRQAFISGWHCEGCGLMYHFPPPLSKEGA